MVTWTWEAIGESDALAIVAIVRVDDDACDCDRPSERHRPDCAALRDLEEGFMEAAGLPVRREGIWFKLLGMRREHDRREKET